MVLMFWLAFAFGATSSVSGVQRHWLPNDAIGGAWAHEDTWTPPDVSATTDPVRQKADEVTGREGGHVRPERLPPPSGGPTKGPAGI